MNVALPNADLCALLLLGLGTPLFGLIRWANRPVMGFGAAALFTLAGIVTLVAGASVKIWLPCIALSLAYPAAAAAGHYRETLLRLLASRRAAALPFLAAGPLFAGAWALWIDYSTSAPPTEVAVTRGVSPALPEPAPMTLQAHTDLGRTVPLFGRPVDELPALRLNQIERWVTAAHPQGVIRTDDADPSYNCHGWVFTAGQFWVRNEAISSLLDDNGYAVVEKPSPGDVVLYRDVDGHVMHSGLVRLIDGGQTVVESKWGHLGRFLHRVNDQPYGDTWAFYRSQRHGHLIRIGDSPSSNEGTGE